MLNLVTLRPIHIVKLSVLFTCLLFSVCHLAKCHLVDSRGMVPNEGSISQFVINLIAIFFELKKQTIPISLSLLDAILFIF